jgi:hypothetical protein
MMRLTKVFITVATTCRTARMRTSTLAAGHIRHSGSLIHLDFNESRYSRDRSVHWITEPYVRGRPSSFTLVLATPTGYNGSSYLAGRIRNAGEKITGKAFTGLRV